MTEQQNGQIGFFRADAMASGRGFVPQLLPTVSGRAGHFRSVPDMYRYMGSIISSCDVSMLGSTPEQAPARKLS